MKKKLIWGILIVVVITLFAIQRVEVTPNNSGVDSLDITRAFPTSHRVKTLLQTACYDCHSNEVKYPNYAYVAPVSWSIKHHVNEGKENVNFSEWMTYNKDQKDHILDEIIETIERKEMQFKGYIPMHPEADLTDAQRKILIDYFKEVDTLTIATDERIIIDKIR